MIEMETMSSEQAMEFQFPQTDFFWDETETRLVGSVCPSYPQLDVGNSLQTTVKTQNVGMGDAVQHSLFEDLAEGRQMNSSYGSTLDSACVAEEDDVVSVDLSIETDGGGSIRRQMYGRRYRRRLRLMCARYCSRWRQWAVLAMQIAAALLYLSTLFLPMGEGQGAWPFGANITCRMNDTPQHLHDIHRWREMAQVVFLTLLTSVLSLFGITVAMVTKWFRSTCASLLSCFVSAFFSMLYMTLLPFKCGQTSRSAVSSFILSSAGFLLLLLMTILNTQMVTYPEDEEDEEDDDRVAESERTPLIIHSMNRSCLPYYYLVSPDQGI